MGLVGTQAAADYRLGWLSARVRDRGLGRELVRLQLDSDFVLFGSFVASERALLRFAGDGPLNTDDHPIVTYQAPGFVYSDPEPPGTRLLALVDALRAEPGDLLAEPRGPAELEFGNRLGAYWRARNAFLHAGVGVAQTADIPEMLAQVREPLLSVARISSDFDPAYRPLLGMAQVLAGMDAERAKSLLTDLEEASPKRTEARSLRRRLFGD